MKRNQVIVGPVSMQVGIYLFQPRYQTSLWV